MEINNNNAAQKLIALNIRPVSLCHEFAARYSERHIDEVIAMARTKANMSLAGWVRAALQQGWVVKPLIATTRQLTPDERRQRAIEDNRKNKERIEKFGVGRTG